MDNKQLYKKIIQGISIKLKNILNEDINKFNTIDYNEDEYDITDYHSVRNIMDFPKNYEQETDFLKNIIPSEKTIKQANLFIHKLNYIFKQLNNIILTDELLEFNKNKISLWCSFYIISEFSNKYLLYTELHINVKYDNWNNRFIFDYGNDKIEKLAKAIEFCNLYGNTMTVIYLGSSKEDYFNKFKEYLITNGIDYKKTFLNTKEDGDSYVPYKFESITDTFSYVQRITKEFIKFMLQYIKDFD